MMYPSKTVTIVEEDVLSRVINKDSLRRFNKAKEYLLDNNFQDGYWIAGGAIRSLFDGTELDDIDLFFNDLDVATKMFNRFDCIQPYDYVDTLHEFYSKDDTHWKDIYYQIISSPQFTGVDKLLEYFDWTICQAAWCPKTYDFHVTREFLMDTGGKRLVPTGTLRNAVKSWERADKYIKKGYTLCNGAREKFLQAAIMNPDSVKDRYFYVD